MARYRILAAATLALTLGVVRSVSAQISDDVVKIGVLTDLSGAAAEVAGQGSVMAAQMAIADFGGTVMGKPIALVSADHRQKPEVAAAIARRWYESEQVDLILDVPLAAAALAVEDVSRQQKKLLIVHSSGPDQFTGKSCSPYGMEWVFDMHALVAGTVKAAAERGGKSWFFLTADRDFGRTLEQDVGKAALPSGVQLLGDVRFPFNTGDLTPFVLQAKASKAKIIGLAATPPDSFNALRIANEYGIFPAQQVAGFLVPITDVHKLGLRAAQGLLVATGFYWDMDGKTRAFSQRFYDKLGRMPTMEQAGVYSSVMHYLNAVKAAKSDDALTVAAKMRATPVEDFFARHGKLREDGLMVHDLYLAEVKKPEDSKKPWDYMKMLQTIPGEQAFPRMEDEGCPLTKK